MQLIDQVTMQLRELQLAARELICTLVPVPCASITRDAQTVVEPIRFTIGVVIPSNSAARFQKLAQLQLEHRTFKSPIGKIMLEATVEPMPISRQQNLFGDSESSNDQTELLGLLELLSHRLGYDRLLSAELTPDILPEQSVRFVPWLPHASLGGRSAAQTPQQHYSGFVRPMTLLSEPQPVRVQASTAGTPRSFRWQMQEKSIAQVWGPERIATHWWQEPQQRDYYRVETITGERYWLYQTTPASWFLHGIFD